MLSDYIFIAMSFGKTLLDFNFTIRFVFFAEHFLSMLWPKHESFVNFLPTDAKRESSTSHICSCNSACRFVSIRLLGRRPCQQISSRHLR